MAQVPYTPFPTVSPQAPGAPPVHISTTPEAFGATIGQGIQQLGGAASHVGDELFQRALAFQQLRNETESRQADADYIIESGKLHDQFMSSEGKNSVDGLLKHNADLEAMRQRYRQGLSNDEARRMFDASSLSTLAWNIRHASGYAAQQQKAYTRGTLQAQADADAIQIRQNPKDEQLFQEKLKRVDANAEQMAEMGGWGKEQKGDYIFKEKSKLQTSRIMETAVSNPFAAQEMLDKNKSMLEDPGRVQNYVEQQRHTVGARNISYNVNSKAEPVAGVPGELIQQIKGIEGFDSRARWDVKQYTIGYGTKAKSPNETLTPGPEADARFNEEIRKAAEIVDKVNSHLTAGTRAALVSLTFNTGENWTNEKLGQAIRNGDEEGAKDLFRQYVNVAGQPSSAIASRRAQEATWFGKDSFPVEGLDSRLERGRVIAEKMYPDDLEFKERVENAIRTEYHKQRDDEKVAEYAARQTVEGALMGSGLGGKIPSSLDELLVDPNTRKAWYQLDKTQQHHYLDALTKIQKGDVAPSRARLDRWQTLKGMAIDEPAKFLENNMADEDLPFAWRRALINKQMSLKERAESDPRVTKAMQDLAPMLEPVQITKHDDPMAYWKFQGALQDVLDDFQKEHKKGPNIKELNEIGARLMQDQITSRGFIWNTRERTFEMSVPTEEMDKIKADPRWSELGITPSDDMIRRAYVRQQYEKLYGGKAKPKEEQPNKPKPGTTISPIDIGQSP